MKYKTIEENSFVEVTYSFTDYYKKTEELTVYYVIPVEYKSFFEKWTKVYEDDITAEN